MCKSGGLYTHTADLKIIQNDRRTIPPSFAAQNPPPFTQGRLFILLRLCTREPFIIYAARLLGEDLLRGFIGRCHGVRPQLSQASLVQREVSPRSGDGGIVLCILPICRCCKMIVKQSPTRCAGAPFAQGGLFYSCKWEPFSVLCYIAFLCRLWYNVPNIGKI